MGSNARKVVSVRVTDNQAAVVFVHGFGGHTTKTWAKFPELLTEDSRFNGWDVLCVGYESKLVPDFLRGVWTSDADLKTLGTLLCNTLQGDGLGAYKRLVLIAHSMGGLIVQKALVDHSELVDRVDHVFFFGTPSNGLKKAGRFFWVKDQVGDMAAGSPFITELRRVWKDRFGRGRSFGLHVFAGERDQFVPPVSSLENFPDDLCHVIPGDHLSMVKPNDATAPCYGEVATRVLEEAFEAGPLDSARLAVQRGDWQDAVNILEPAARDGDLSNSDAVEYALALEGLGRQEEAIAFLERRDGPSTDLMGTLAGRLKRLFVHEHRESMGARALRLYEDAYRIAEAKGDHGQCHYHAVNVAFLSFLLADRTAPGRMEASREWARRTLGHVAQADDHWRHASSAEALLYLDEDFAECLKHYAEALQHLDEPWEVRSMYLQARIYLEEIKAFDRLESLEYLLASDLEEAEDV